MPEGDFLDDRRRASEDDYFRKKDRELVEKMRAAAAADRAKSELSASTGLSDPALLAELAALGFTPETVSVLPLVPIVEMAWAEGGVTAAERTLLVTLAREPRDRGRQPGRSAAVGMAVAAALARRLRARHAVDPRHARHGFPRERDAHGRRVDQVQREYRRGLGRHPRPGQGLGGRARHAGENRGGAQDAKLVISRHARGALDVLTRRRSVAVDPRRPPDTSARRAAEDIGAQHEAPPARLGSIEDAPLPAGICREVGAKRRPAGQCAWRQHDVGELLVDSVVADPNAESQGLGWRAVNPAIDGHLRDKRAAPRNGQHEDEPARRNRPDGRFRPAGHGHVSDLESRSRRARLGVADVAHEVDDPDRRGIRGRARRERQRGQRQRNRQTNP